MLSTELKETLLSWEFYVQRTVATFKYKDIFPKFVLNIALMCSMNVRPNMYMSVCQRLSPTMERGAQTVVYTVAAE